MPTIMRFTTVVVSAFQVLNVDQGSPPIQNGYHCDSFEGPCSCPYDNSQIQAFESHAAYKQHMANVHGEAPFQKRKMKKAPSQRTILKKSAATKALHANGTFLNTHVKKEVLLEFVDIYDRFLNEVFRSDEYEGGDYKRKWLYFYRIQSRDLEERSLERLISDIKEGGGSMYYERALARLERDFDE